MVRSESLNPDFVRYLSYPVTGAFVAGSGLVSAAWHALAPLNVTTLRREEQ